MSITFEIVTDECAENKSCQLPFEIVTHEYAENMRGETCLLPLKWYKRHYKKDKHMSITFRIGKDKHAGNESDSEVLAED